MAARRRPPRYRAVVLTAAIAFSGLHGLTAWGVPATRAAGGQKNRSAVAATAGSAPTLVPVTLVEPEEKPADPSDEFVRAFAAFRQGESLEDAQKWPAAFAKYQFALELLERISRDNPNWQPLIVKYRLRKTNERIAHLQPKVAPPRSEAPAPGGGSTVPAESATLRGGPGANATPTPAAVPPGLPENPGGPTLSLTAGVSGETPLPEPDRGGGPAVIDPSAGGALPTPAKPTDPPPVPAALPAEPVVGKAGLKMVARLEKLQAELKATREQLETARHEKTQLQDRLDASQSDLQTAAKKFDRTRVDRDEVEAQLDRAQVRLKEALAKNPDAVDTRKELRQQVSGLKESLAKAEAAARSAEEERAAALEKAKQAPSGEVENRIHSLEGANATLTDKLRTAELTIQQLGDEAKQKQLEVEKVQKELVQVRAELTSARDQNDRATTQLTELQAQLDASNERLAQGVSKDELGRLTKENELLRTVSLRLLRDQARRVQASKLLSDELTRLEVQSNTLNDQLTQLDRPTVQLTDEERGLFRAPLVDVSHDPNNSRALALSLVAVAHPPLAGGSGPEDRSGTKSLAGDPGPAGAAAPTAGTDGGNPAANARPPVPDELLPLAQQAKKDLEQGRYAEAEEAYRKIVARAPTNVYALSNFGVALSRGGKFKPAEASLRKALALSPDDPFCHATLGIIYYQLHRFDDAVDNLTKAITLDPKNAAAHNYLGITSSQKGWPEAAVQELNKALALNPNYADAHFNLAVVYALNQPADKSKAEEHYRKATELGVPPDPALEKLIRK